MQLHIFISLICLCIKYAEGVEDIRFAPAIVGGIEAGPSQWPWHAALKAYGSFVCSGSLIAPRWVITAAHCLYNQLKRPIRSSQLNIRLGIHYLSSTNPEEKSVNVTNSIIHPKFQYILTLQGFIPYYDIALLELEEAVQTNWYIRTLPLPPPGSHLMDGASVYTTGWGYIYNDAFPKLTQYSIKGFGIISMEASVRVIPDALQQLQTTVSSKKDCESFTSTQNDVICIGDIQGGTGPCHGDSGGPLMARNQARRGWTLYGVLSYGHEMCGRPVISGVYTEVSGYVNWILNSTNRLA